MKSNELIDYLNNIIHDVSNNKKLQISLLEWISKNFKNLIPNNPELWVISRIAKLSILELKNNNRDN